MDPMHKSYWLVCEQYVICHFCCEDSLNLNNENKRSRLIALWSSVGPSDMSHQILMKCWWMKELFSCFICVMFCLVCWLPSSLSDVQLDASLLNDSNRQLNEKHVNPDLILSGFEHCWKYLGESKYNITKYRTMVLSFLDILMEKCYIS